MRHLAARSVPLLQRIHVQLPGSGLMHPGFGFRNLVALRILQQPRVRAARGAKGAAGGEEEASAGAAGRASAPGKSSGRGPCLHPVVVFRDTQLNEHVTANRSTTSLQPCLVRVGHGSSAASAGGAQLLQPQLACEAVAALDPFCSYSLSLGIDFVGTLPGLVVGNLYAVVALAQCLLLLAVARRPHAARRQQVAAAAVAGTAATAPRVVRLPATAALSWLGVGLLSAAPGVMAVAVAATTLAAAWGSAGCTLAVASPENPGGEGLVCVAVRWVVARATGAGAGVHGPGQGRPALGLPLSVAQLLGQGGLTSSLQAAITSLLPYLPLQLPPTIPHPALDFVALFALLHLGMAALLLLACAVQLGVWLVCTPWSCAAWLHTRDRRRPSLLQQQQRQQQCSSAQVRVEGEQAGFSAQGRVEGEQAGLSTLPAAPLGSSDAAPGSSNAASGSSKVCPSSGNAGPSSVAGSLAMAAALCYSLASLVAVASHVGLGMLLAWLGLLVAATVQAARGSSSSRAGVVNTHTLTQAQAQAPQLQSLALYYGSTALTLLPSLVAWVRLQPAHRHSSEPADLLLLLPPVVHCCVLLTQAAWPGSGAARTEVCAGPWVSWACRVASLLLFGGTLYAQQFLLYPVQAGLACVLLAAWLHRTLTRVAGWL